MVRAAVYHGMSGWVVAAVMIGWMVWREAHQEVTEAAAPYLALMRERKCSKWVRRAGLWDSA